MTEADVHLLIHSFRLFGPKRKMTSAIARWHSSARPPSDALELAYADRLEAEMQELAIQLHKVSGEVQAGCGHRRQDTATELHFYSRGDSVNRGLETGNLRGRMEQSKVKGM